MKITHYIDINPTHIIASIYRNVDELYFWHYKKNESYFDNKTNTDIGVWHVKWKN